MKEFLHIDTFSEVQYPQRGMIQVNNSYTIPSYIGVGVIVVHTKSIFSISYPQNPCVPNLTTYIMRSNRQRHSITHFLSLLSADGITKG
jgi:hypothetical protein